MDAGAGRVRKCVGWEYKQQAMRARCVVGARDARARDASSRA